jgi:hypothetical protein
VCVDVEFGASVGTNVDDGPGIDVGAGTDVGVDIGVQCLVLLLMLMSVLVLVSVLVLMLVSLLVQVLVSVQVVPRWGCPLCCGQGGAYRQQALPAPSRSRSLARTGASFETRPVHREAVCNRVLSTLILEQVSPYKYQQ